MTHIQITFKINKQKKCYRQGERQKLELESKVLGELYLCYLMIRLLDIKLYNRETTALADGRSPFT